MVEWEIELKLGYYRLALCWLNAGFIYGLSNLVWEWVERDLAEPLDLLGWDLILSFPFFLFNHLFLILGDGQTPGYKSYNLKVVDLRVERRLICFHSLEIYWSNIIITVVPLVNKFLLEADRRGLPGYYQIRGFDTNIV